MRKILVVVAVVAVLGLVGLVLFLNAQTTAVVDVSEQTDQGAVGCTQEAMICPDGTAVGREGENCEFAACPAEVQPVEPIPGGVESGQTSIETTGTAQVGESITLNTVQIVPTKIISDSRCPAEVECIWAGTVELQVTLGSNQDSGVYALTLGEATSFAGKTVTLTAVYPEKTQVMSNDISSYSFVFEVN